MKQNVVTERIMRVLVKRGLIYLKDYDEIAPFFDQAYAAGYTERHLEPAHRRPVVQLSKDLKKIQVHESTMAAERVTQISNQSISACATGKKNHNTAGGYKWKYLDEY
jgi:hypothetical protein